MKTAKRQHTANVNWETHCILLLCVKWCCHTETLYLLSFLCCLSTVRSMVEEARDGHHACLSFKTSVRALGKMWFTIFSIFFSPSPLWEERNRNYDLLPQAEYVAALSNFFFFSFFPPYPWQGGKVLWFP